MEGGGVLCTRVIGINKGMRVGGTEENEGIIYIFFLCGGGGES